MFPYNSKDILDNFIDSNLAFCRVMVDESEMEKVHKNLRQYLYRNKDTYGKKVNLRRRGTALFLVKPNTVELKGQ